MCKKGKTERNFTRNFRRMNEIEIGIGLGTKPEIIYHHLLFFTCANFFIRGQKRKKRGEKGRKGRKGEKKA